MVKRGMVSFIFRSYVKINQAKGLIIILILRIISRTIMCIQPDYCISMMFFYVVL